MPIFLNFQIIFITYLLLLVAVVREIVRVPWYGLFPQDKKTQALKLSTREEIFIAFGIIKENEKPTKVQDYKQTESTFSKIIKFGFPLQDK